MFKPEQVAALSGPLASSAVKTRTQAGRSLSYVEGWHVIAEANSIFGFDAWDRETVELRQLGEPREVEGKFRVAYLARVRIIVRSRGQDDENAMAEPWEVTVRDGCGYGSGIDRDLGSAHESALKEAETDAMKRALMTFGNPFGLALYDKEQRNVADERAPPPAKRAAPPAKVEAPEPPDESKIHYIRTVWKTLDEPMTREELRDWWQAGADARRSFGINPELVEHWKAKVKERLAQLDRRAAA